MAPCKVSFDPTSAKEMLLMAASLKDQQQWVTRLLKRIQKSGFKVYTENLCCNLQFRLYKIINPENLVSYAQVSRTHVLFRDGTVLQVVTASNLEGGLM